MNVTALALCTGAPAPLPDGRSSAIEKRAREGEMRILRLGLEGDAQADLRNHGGPDMAVHHYPVEHYAYWREVLPMVERLNTPGAFGENIHASGLVEGDVHIGDRFRFGTALLEVSMGRQPCSKLESHFGQPELVRRIIENGRCGWYYRVLEEGSARAGDSLELVERGDPHWTVERAFALLFRPSRQPSRQEMEEFVKLPALGPAWRAKGLARLL